MREQQVGLCCVHWLPLMVQCPLYLRPARQFRLTPDALIGAAHLSISLTTNLARYSGDLRSGATRSVPAAFSRSCTAGVFIVATAAPCSFWMIGAGVPLGKKMAYQVEAWKLDSPCSCADARAGRLG